MESKAIVSSKNNSCYASGNFSKIFVGKINYAYDIVMRVIAIDGKVDGMYYYKSVGTQIGIDGSIDYSGNIILNEYDPNGNQTGVFKGIITNKNRIDGYWSKPNGKNSMPFTLTESNGQFELLKPQSNKFSYIVGTYEMPVRSMDPYASIGTVKIEQIKDGNFSFEISVSNFMKCTGTISGIAVVNDEWIAVYWDEDCERLTFSFYRTEVLIEERNCDTMHGQNCSFNGHYIKK